MKPGAASAVLRLLGGGSGTVAGAAGAGAVAVSIATDGSSGNTVMVAGDPARPCQDGGEMQDRRVRIPVEAELSCS